MMKMLRVTRVEPPLGAQMAFGRVVQPLGWFGLGALTAGAVAWALLRSGRWPSNGEEPDTQGPDTQEPDVLLDVSELEVDKINLEVERLRAHVSILVELANLLSLSVGVDARLARVQLEIEGVEAKVLLKVRLRHVRAILEKALDTIGEHPEILQSLVRTVDRTLGEVGGVAREAVGEGGAVSQVTRGVGEATQRVGDAAGQAVGQVGQTANQAVGQVTDQAGNVLEETVNEAGQTVQRVVDESGSVVERTLNESGEVLDEAVVDDASDTGSEGDHSEQE